VVGLGGLGGWLSFGEVVGGMASLFQWFSWFRSDYANLLGIHRFVPVYVAFPSGLAIPRPLQPPPSRITPIIWIPPLSLVAAHRLA